MRTITAHHDSAINNLLSIEAMSADYYRVEHDTDEPRTAFHAGIRFHSGPLADGVNGLTNEALLAIVADRLQQYQIGPLACSENQEASDCINKALDWLTKRTADRLARGVEGTQLP